MQYTTLVSTEILEANYNNSDWIIFDCRSSLFDHSAGLKAYNENHIPNAIFSSLEDDLSSPVTQDSGRHPLPDFNLLIKKLGDWGVSDKTQVIAYDDVGGAFAVRLWWQLRTFGHKNIAVLDGGIPQWKKENKPLAQKPTLLKDANQTIFKASINKSTWVTSEQLYKNLKSKEYMVLDARTPERYRGESEPIDTVAGRIPDSINRAFQLNLNEQGLFLSTEELKQQFKPIIALSPDKKPENIVHLCGSGVTACHNMMAMELAGYKDSKLYAGSWSEWIRDNNRPVATG